MINNNIARLNITVHDAHRVCIIKGFQHLEHVVSDVVISEGSAEFAEVHVVAHIDDLSYDRRVIRHGVFDYFIQLNDIRPTLHCLQNFYLTADLPHLDWFQYFYGNFLISFFVFA